MALKDTLKKLFTRNVVIKRLPGGRTKTYDISKSQSIGSPTTYSNRARWRNGRSFNSVSGYGSGFTNEEIEAVRRQMYLDYELMDTDAIISSALDLYADQCTTVSINDELLVIKTDDVHIKKILHNLFYDVLNIEFNLWSWIRTMCKYGDFFLYLQIAEEYGVINVQPIHPSLMVREEGTRDDPEQIRFRYEGDMGFHTAQNTFEAYEIAHFRMLTDTNFLPYGRSIIEPGKKSYKQLVLMEDAMMIHRIMRAPERRIIKIDIGNIAPEEVDAHVEQIVAEMKKVPFVDPVTGDYNLKFNLQNAIEDWFMPVRGESNGTSVDVLPGLQNEGQTDDIEFFKNKLLASLKIPKDYLGYGADSAGGKANLAQIDIIFARTIERIQKIFVSELYKIAVIHLKTQGFSLEEILNFEIMLTNPSLVFERQKIDVLTAKVDLVKSIKEDNLFSDKYIYENIFNLSEDEWQADRDRAVEDAKHKFRLTQIIEEGNDPEVTGKSFGTPHDIASMQVASKFVPNQGTEDMKKLYTPDEREENEGKPKQFKSNFETKRDQDFGRDPVGRRENDKVNIPGQTQESIKALFKKFDKTMIKKQKVKNQIKMLNEENLLDK